MKKVQLDDFTKFNFLSALKHSPDGKHVCYVVSKCDLDDNKYISNLWILDIKSRDNYMLTSCDDARSFVWLDNENIMFASLRDQKDKDKHSEGYKFTEYYKINIHHGESTKFIKIDDQISTIKRINENEFLFTAEHKIGEIEAFKLSDSEKAEEVKRINEQKDYEILDEIPFWANGDGFTNGKRNRLYLYNMKTNYITALTDELTSVESFNLDESKTKIVIISNKLIGKMELNNEIGIYDLVQKSYKKLRISDNLCYYSAYFLNDSNLILIASDMKHYGLNQNEDFYIVGLNDEKKYIRKSNFDKALTNSVGSDTRYGHSSLTQVHNGKLYFVTTEGCNSYLNVIDEKLEKTKLTSVDGSVDGISIDDEIMLIAMRENKLEEIYMLCGSDELQLTRHNEWIQEQLCLSTPKRFNVMTSPGVNVEGFIIEPVDFDKNKKYPAILDIHGGPKTVYGSIYCHEMQYFAANGYFVFYCNPRGSDGKGNEFADIRGKYGSIDYEDLMKFTDEVVTAVPQIDVNRIGVMGGSYGGYMTNWIIGHTNRFSAAASQRSIANWISKFNTTDIGYFFVEDQVGSTPWNNHEKLWDNSPLKYADKVKTPTLFIHSEQDYRCWLAEGIQMFTALKYHGVESRLCMFRDENHELTRSGKPRNRVKNLEEISKWFNKFL